MIPAEKIQLFSSVKKLKICNPQEVATFQLLQIADEENYDLYDSASKIAQNCPQLQNHRSSFQRTSKVFKNQRQTSSNLLISRYLGKKPNNLHNQSKRYISGQEVCVVKKEKVVNLGNFFLIDSVQAAPTAPIEAKQELPEASKPGFRAKSPKNIVAFIRRRNLSYLKEQFSCQLQQKNKQNLFNNSQQRIQSQARNNYSSCQLKKSQQETKYLQPALELSDRQINSSTQLNSTSPNFRYRRVSNYIKNRMGSKKRQNPYW